MYQDAFTHSGVPDAYPLGISGLGNIPSRAALISMPTPSQKAVNDAWKSIQDHDAITSADYNRVEAAIRDRQYDFAYKLIDELRRKIAVSRRPSSNPVDRYLPSGYGLSDQLISGVPNWILYATAVGFVALSGKVLRRKHV